MNNILTIRPDLLPHVRLAHYSALNFQSPSLPDTPSHRSVVALRRRLHASQRLNLALDAERRRNDALLGKLRAALGLPADGNVKTEDAEQGARGSSSSSPFGFLRGARAAGLEHVGSNTPIATTAEFTLSQLQALRALSTSLRTLLPDLAPASTSPDEEDDNDDPSAGPRSWRRERVEYVEGASRKYLETARGLELGAQGEVRDGEWQGRGRKVTRAEVEALESAVMLEGGGQQQQQRRTEGGEPMDES